MCLVGVLFVYGVVFDFDCYVLGFVCVFYYVFYVGLV